MASALCASAASAVAEINAAAADSLRARYQALGEQLAHNQFQQPLVLESTESPSDLRGDIYARVDYPFAVVNAALNDPHHWCDVLILHVNTKYCHASTQGNDTVLTMNVGAKHEQALDEAYRVEFVYSAVATTPNYFQVQLSADKGPLSTRDYRILLEATPAETGKTFLHLTYAYAYGLPGRMALKTYLATVGRGKVGFTKLGTQSNGQPDYIAGVRGLVERNTMRYELAINAYLAALNVPPERQLQQRLQNWFSATERYPRQLYEVDRSAYIAMKGREYQRQQTAQ